MLTNIALRTLISDRGKLLVGLIGVVFSFVLVNVQGGLFFGLLDKATVLIDRGNADIWVGSRGMHYVDFPHDIPEQWIFRIRSMPGVEEVEPIRIGVSEINLPDGSYEGVMLVGTVKGSQLGKAYGLVEGPEDALHFPDSIVVDQCDDDKLGSPKVGELREINGHRVRVMGKTHGVLNFLVTPYVFTTYQRVAELTGSNPNMASYLLVRAAEGTNKADLCREIEARLESVSAMTKEQYARKSIAFWMTRTGLGLSFGTATLLGLLVGLVMVAQTLYAMVLDRISEYATLKAMGATEREILILLSSQSAFVAATGIALGLGLTILIKTTLSTPVATIEIPFELYLCSGTLVFVICVIASALPYLRVRRVDPHSVLQG